MEFCEIKTAYNQGGFRSTCTCGWTHSGRGYFTEIEKVAILVHQVENLRAILREASCSNCGQRPML